MKEWTTLLYSPPKDLICSNSFFTFLIDFGLLMCNSAPHFMCSKSTCLTLDWCCACLKVRFRESLVLWNGLAKHQGIFRWSVVVLGIFKFLTDIKVVPGSASGQLGPIREIMGLGQAFLARS